MTPQQRRRHLCIVPDRIYRILLFSAALLFSVVCAAEARTTINRSQQVEEGIEIPYIQTRCDSHGVLLNSTFAYLLSPRPIVSRKPDFTTRFECKWILEVEDNSTIRVIIKSLDTHKLTNVSFYDGAQLEEGVDSEEMLMQTFSGRVQFAQMQTRSSHLTIVYSGVQFFAQMSTFRLYFEESAPEVWCGEDEQNKLQRCRNRRACFSAQQRCDGRDDCGDGTDEQDCPHTDRHAQQFSRMCGTRTHSAVFESKEHRRIFGGTLARRGEWPWMASLRRVVEEPEGHVCGASILNRNWLVTAAHCFYNNLQPEKWTVNVAKFQKLVHDSQEIVRYIKQIVPHPDFKGIRQTDVENNNLTWYDMNKNDIALIELNAPLPDTNELINAICLPVSHQNDDNSTNSSQLIGRQATVAGWGTTYNTGNPYVLKQTTVPIITNQKCKEWMPEFNLGPEMFCAGYEEGGEDSCRGDSGGPLMLENHETGHFELVGIVSSGGECGAPRQAGIYTNMFHYTEWIETVIQLNGTASL